MSLPVQRSIEIMETSYIIVRIESIQRELEDLKRLVKATQETKPAPRLKGIWKGMEVFEEDIEEAKRSVFKGAYGEWPKTSS